MSTPASGLGGGAYQSPSSSGGTSGGVQPGSSGTMPRPSILSPEAVGGNSDGPYSENGEGNPYYSGDRGDKPGSGSGSGGGQPVEPRPYQGQ